YYFGEDVDVYKDGKVVGHPGSWLAGEKGARFGRVMPGLPLVKARYFHEVAPGAAMGRAEIGEVGATVKPPAGESEGCGWSADTSCRSAPSTIRIPISPASRSSSRAVPSALVTSAACSGRGTSAREFCSAGSTSTATAGPPSASSAPKTPAKPAAPRPCASPG